MPTGWEWDESLYRGSAPYYERGRPPYASGLTPALARVLALDGRGRLLDVGCGPGLITLPLAPLFAAAVGVAADPDMLAEGQRRAAEAGIANIRWVALRTEALPAGLGAFRVATFAQSFHWMERERVAAIVLRKIEPGGAFVHVSDVKEAPPDAPDPQFPAPPSAASRALIRRYLGPIPRAGQGVLRHGTPDGEAAILRAAGLAGPERLRLPAAGVLERTEDDLVAWVFSLSSSAPHLFGERLPAFESDLRGVLRRASPTGRFAEQPPDTEVFVWRTPEPDHESAPRPAT